MLQPYLVDILQLVFARLRPDALPSATFILDFTHALCVFTSKPHGFAPILSAIDSFQPQFFAKLYESVLMPNLRHVGSDRCRLGLVTGLTTMWFGTPALHAEPYLKLLGNTLYNVMLLATRQEKVNMEGTGGPKLDALAAAAAAAESAGPEADDAFLSDTTGSTLTAFNKLNFAPAPVTDYYPACPSLSLAAKFASAQTKAVLASPLAPTLQQQWTARSEWVTPAMQAFLCAY
jgi:hypothetical protein